MIPTIIPSPVYQVNMLQEHGIPVVFCHRRIQGVLAPLIAIPYLEIGRMAGRELVKLGHRRVAIYHVLPSTIMQPSPSSKDYETGLREVMREAGGDLPNDCRLLGDTETLDTAVQEKEAWPKLKELFSQPDRPTAIMTNYDTMGEIVYLALQKMGLRVPEDVSVISFGGKDHRGAIVRRLTSVVVDGADVGRRAANLLQEMFNGQRAINNNEEIVMPLSLSDGQTLGPAPR